jgi:voltage-gated potassium channel
MNNLGPSQDAYDRFSAAVDGPLTVLAVLWLPVLVVPLVIRVRAGVAGTLDLIDYVVWAVFVAEYLIKCYLAPSRGLFVRRHLIDLLVIAVPVLRPLRLLRVLRLLRLARAGLILSTALKRARELLTHHGLHFVLLSVLAIVGVGSAVELAFEQHAPGSNIHDFADALWWAIVTVTTVGYGDKYPVSAGGRGVAVVLMLTGIGLVGVLSATVASYFVGQRADADMLELHRKLDRIEALLTQAPPPAPQPPAAPPPAPPPPGRSEEGTRGHPDSDRQVQRPWVGGAQSTQEGTRGHTDTAR